MDDFIKVVLLTLIIKSLILYNLQVCLLKSAAFEVAMIALGTRFYLDEVSFPTDGVYITRKRLDELHIDFFDEKFRFFAKLKKLNLTDTEIALLTTLILTSPGETKQQHKQQKSYTWIPSKVHRKGHIHSSWCSDGLCVKYIGFQCHGYRYAIVFFVQGNGLKVRAVIRVLTVKGLSNKSWADENISFCYTCDASSGWKCTVVLPCVSECHDDWPANY